MPLLNVRPIFLPCSRYPYYEVWNAQMVNFVPSTSMERAQRNIKEVFRVFDKRFPNKKLLEISLASLQLPLGKDLCPQYLKKNIPSKGGLFPVESLFQASKVFVEGGPYEDLYDYDALEIKDDPRLLHSGILTSYRFENQEYPLHPKTAFFDYMYMQALLEPQNAEICNQLLEYDAFCDILFQEKRDFVCPARSAVVFVSLMRLGILQKMHSFEEFCTVITGNNEGRTTQVRTQADEFHVGDSIMHPSWGKGRIIATVPKLLVHFNGEAGDKFMNPTYVKENCQLLPAETLEQSE